MSGPGFGDPDSRRTFRPNVVGCGRREVYLRDSVLLRALEVTHKNRESREKIRTGVGSDDDLPSSSLRKRGSMRRNRRKEMNPRRSCRR